MSDLSTDVLHMTSPLRTGRRVGRTIYVQLGPEPSDVDPLVATADSPVLAERIVRAVNAVPMQVGLEDLFTPVVGWAIVKADGAVRDFVMGAQPPTPTWHDLICSMHDGDELRSLTTGPSVSPNDEPGHVYGAPAQPAVAPDTLGAAPTRDELITAAFARLTALPGIDDAPVYRVATETVDAVLGVLRGGGADGSGEDEDGRYSRSFLLHCLASVCSTVHALSLDISDGSARASLIALDHWLATGRGEDETTAALRELVTLKDGDRDEDYERRKPLAWSRARRVLGIPEETTVPVDPEADYDAHAGPCPSCGHEIDLREVCHVCRRVPSVRGEPVPDLPWSMTRPMDFADDDADMPELGGQPHPDDALKAALSKGIEHGRQEVAARLARAAGVSPDSEDVVGAIEAAIRAGREPEVVTGTDEGPFRVAGPGAREYPGPKAPRGVDLDACPIWPCNDAKAEKAQKACGTWKDCAHDRRTLVGEIARLRAVVGWVKANDHVHTWQVAKRLGKDYGRASAEIARLRGELARMRSEERETVTKLRAKVERYRQIATVRAPAPAPAPLTVGDEVKTPEQLAALPAHAVLRDASFDVCERMHDRWRCFTGTDHIDLPARILDLPGGGKA